MNDATPVVSSPPPDDVLEALADALRELWERGGTPDVDVFIAEAGVSSAAALALLLSVDQEERWVRDREISAEEYLHRYPALNADPEFGPDLIYGEILLRECRGETPALDEYRKRYPQFAEELGRQWEVRALLPAPLPAGPPAPHGYEILGELGRGGMGVVYRARDVTLDREVALKMILSGHHASDNERGRFLREARSVAQMQHPNIVQVYEVGQEGNQPYLALEYCPGGSLGDRLRNAPLPPQEAAEMVRTLAGAVQAAHDKGIIHRDLKPANVLLGVEGVPKVADFGLAKKLGAAINTESGCVAGTLSYMSPDQALGKEPSILWDVYALGAILYECLTRRPPFSAPTAWETLQQVISEDPVTPRQLSPAIPRDLETICLKCLHRNPARRYATARELATDLGRFLDGLPIGARPTSAFERAVKWARRKPAVTALIAVIALAVLLLSGMGVWSYWQIHEALGEAQASALIAQTERNEAQKERNEAQAQRAIAEAERDASRTAFQSLALDGAHRMLRQGRYDAADHDLASMPASRWGWEADRISYEVSLSPRPAETLGTHDWGIADLVPGRDGRSLFTIGHDGRFVRWDGAGPGDDGGVWSSGVLKPAPVAGGAWSRDRLQWCHALEPAQPGSTDGVPDCFLKLCRAGDGTLLTASNNGRGLLWTASTGRNVEVVSHDRPLYAAASADGDRFVFGDADGVLLAVGREGEKHRRFEGLKGSAILDAASLDPAGWVVAQADGTVSLIDPQATRILHRLKTSGPAWALDVAPDGRVVAVAGRSLTLYSLDAAGAELKELETYALPLEEGRKAETFQAVRFSPDGKRLYAGDDGGRVVGWERGKAVPEFVRMDQGATVRPPRTVTALPLPFQRRVAALAVSPDGQTLLSAGRDTGIKRWDLRRQSGITVLRVGSEPTARFDHADPALLWVAGGDGSLALWDTRTGRRRAVADRAHDGHPVRSLAASDGGRLMATCADDGSIRCWARSGDNIRSEHEPIKHKVPLRRVALSPDGSLVAGYDDADEVHLWETRTQKLMGRVSMKKPEGSAAVSPHLAFNSNGDTLAVIGPAQSFSLFSVGDLNAPPRNPHLVRAREGGTALAWHPREPERVLVGDHGGGLNAHGWPDDRRNFRGYPPRSPVRGLGFSPDGTRLAVVCEDGKVWLFDPSWVGAVHDFSSPFSRPTDVFFDPTGHRLAVVHQDGHVAIWETGIEPRTESKRGPTTWHEKVLIDGQHNRFLTLRQAVTRLDREGRVNLLFVRPMTPPNGKRTYQWGVLWGKEVSEGSLDEEPVTDIEGPDESIGHAVARTLALSVESEQVLAVVRRPRSDLEAIAGDVMAFRRERAGVWSGTSVTGPVNAGWDAQLLPETSGTPAIFHFDMAGYSLRASSPTRAGWTSPQVGRQGDGEWFRLLGGTSGPVHLIFKPKRFAGDPSPLTYVRLSGSDHQETLREVVDPATGPIDSGPFPSLAVGTDGEPFVLYKRLECRAREEVVVASRRSTGWERSVVLKPPGKYAVSNLHCDKDGTLRFAYVEQGVGRLHLATRRGNIWRTEVIWSGAQAVRGIPNEINEIDMVLLGDSENCPVLVAGSQSRGAQWVRVFRTRH